MNDLAQSLYILASPVWLFWYLLIAVRRRMCHVLTALQAPLLPLFPFLLFYSAPAAPTILLTSPRTGACSLRCDSPPGGSGVSAMKTHSPVSSVTSGLTLWFHRHEGDSIFSLNASWSVLLEKWHHHSWKIPWTSLADLSPPLPLPGFIFSFSLLAAINLKAISLFCRPFV